MQGKIISFNIHERQGTIIADDGVQYIFEVDSWAAQDAPRAGENIEFTFDETGQVTRVARLSTQTHTPTPPPIPPSLQKQPQSHSTPSAQAYNNNSDQSFNNQSFNNQNLNNQSHADSAAIYAEEERYNVVDWTKKVILNNYANFGGRARRKEYWFFNLGYFALSIIAVILDVIIGTEEYGLLQTLLSLALFIPTIAVGSRRLHDIGRSGWWQLLWFIPIIGWILLIVWFASDTSPQHNKWGAPARDV